MGKYKNVKPAKEFDARYNTKVSQDYEFPFQLTADEVWDVIKESNYGTDNAEKYNIILDSIEFPWLDMKLLSDMKRLDVIMGMASCINSDDIIWYIQGNHACSPKSLAVDQEIREVLGDFAAQNHIGWVISERTWDRIEEQLFVING